VEIVVPALRQSVERLVYSLSKCDPQPELVTLVSNEVQPFDSYGLRVRLVRFSSKVYPIGYMDVTLRQNVGLYLSDCEVVVIQGDDQIAPHSMLRDVADRLGNGNYLWGNHRLVDFDQYTLDQIMDLDMRDGLSRERPVPPAQHGYWSCYGGMFAARTDFIQSFGGFDMAFNGTHGNEDQQLGYRLMQREGKRKVMIWEPPYSWHSIELRDGNGRGRATWLKPKRNGCAVHDLVPERRGRFAYLACQKCLYYRFDGNSAELFNGELVERYDPKMVTTRSRWLT
jgi:hypothetical protein